MDDFRKILYGVIVGFIAIIVGWVSFLTFSGCGSSFNNCNAALPKVQRTSIPTLIPATFPLPVQALLHATSAAAATEGPAVTESAESENTAARPSNPGGPGPAVDLTGNADAGKQIFVTNCQTCHAAEGKGGNPNPGSTDGDIPALNPIDPTIANADLKTFAANIDLFVEHGSTPEGVGPTFSMPAWGDKKVLTPQQIADVIAYVISLNPAASSVAAPTPLGGVDIARPSNPGGPGPALSLTGDAASGKQIFATNCQTCHAAEGKGGNPNPGSSDGVIPPLNPIDSTLVSGDYKTFATNVDLFVEHGSTPAGPGPTFSMPAWGDKKALTPQQIADVIAYVISLNPAPAAGASGGTSTPPTSATASLSAGATQAEPEATEEAARPSNPGGPGQAVTLTGDPTAGQQVFSTNCQTCHAAQGAGGNPNPGSSDGTIPALNPIDPTLKSSDPKVFATNLDLFIEHGSTPEGPSPTFTMPPWGDKGALTPQQIADVIAYIMSLNK